MSPRLTRRQWLTSAIGSALLTGYDGRLSRALGYVTSDSSFSLTLRRPQDQLVLGFTFENAKIAHEIFKNPRIVRVDSSRPITTVVKFPPQAINEEAFYEGANPDPLTIPPISSELSGGSRLAFEIDSDDLDYTETALLDWSAWTPRRVLDIRPLREICPPAENETSIELPARLILSPEAATKWHHALAPIVREGFAETWHTAAFSEAGLPKFRAVWSPDLDGGGCAAGQPSKLRRQGLLKRDRIGLIEATHAAEFQPESLDPRRLILSPIGGWLDLKKSFDAHKALAGLPLAWRERISVGRPTFEQLEYAAFLWPVGFFVSVIKTTERKVEKLADGSEYAYLRQHFTIKFRDDEKLYSTWDFPLLKIQITELETPYLDIAIPIFGPPPKDEDDAWSRPFVPMIGGVPYEFKFRGFDANANPVSIPVPCICVPTGPHYQLDLPAVQNAYRAQDSLRTRQLFQQSLAFTAERAPLMATLAVHQFIFDGEITSWSGEVTDPSFRPKMESAEVSLPSAQGLGATSPGKRGWFLPYNVAAAKNSNEVYLVRDAVRGGEIPVRFSQNADRAGGVMGPALVAAGFSARTGPFGGSTSTIDAKGFATGNDYTSGGFDPSDFFGDDAKILGGIPLKAILVAVAAAGSDYAPKVLSLLEDEIDGSGLSLTQSFAWTTTALKDTPGFAGLDSIFRTQQGKTNAVPNIEEESAFQINCSARMNIETQAEPQGRLFGVISNFGIQLSYQGQGVLIKINSALFDCALGAKPSFGVDIANVDLIGDALSFIRKLQELFSSFADSNRTIDVDPSGVVVNLPSIDLPKIELGAFSLENLSIRSSAILPFDSKPLQFRFMFSSEASPFVMAVGVYGGGGFAQIDMDTEGLRTFSVSLQFGATKSLSLGVFKGKAFLFAGFFYGLKRDPKTNATWTIFTAFVHAGGSATLWGMVEVGVDFYVGLTIKNGYATGSAQLTYSVKVGFFNKSASVTYSTKISGNEPPRDALLLESADGGKRKATPFGKHISFDDWVALRSAVKVQK